MNYIEFKRLIDAGECSRVDFNIHCSAFDSSSPDCSAAKAELAKDICAFANNGNVASYIIVGVSDDRRNFKSISNIQLTDDNLQAFCKLAIFPPVSLRLTNYKWAGATQAHAGKTFTIIQVGPN